MFYATKSAGCLFCASLQAGMEFGHANVFVISWIWKAYSLDSAMNEAAL